MSWADPCSRCGDHRADCECYPYSDDSRYKLMKERFQTLSKKQLQRMKDKINIILFDVHNYHDGKFCPMGVALSLDELPDPTDLKVKEGIGKFYQPTNMLKGVDGKFYHGTDAERRKDLLSLINELLR